MDFCEAVDDCVVYGCRWLAFSPLPLAAAPEAQPQAHRDPHRPNPAQARHSHARGASLHPPLGAPPYEGRDGLGVRKKEKMKVGERKTIFCY
jgi:hypothetical protein